MIHALDDNTLTQVALSVSVVHLLETPCMDDRRSNAFGAAGRRSTSRDGPSGVTINTTSPDMAAPVLPSVERSRPHSQRTLTDRTINQSSQPASSGRRRAPAGRPAGVEGPPPPRLAFGSGDDPKDSTHPSYQSRDL